MKKEKKEENKIEGLNAKCFICGNIINEKSVEKGNVPVRMNNIPGFIHKRCRGELTCDLISNPIDTENLHGQMVNLLKGE